MKIIGITGMAGSGKTTLSKMLCVDNNTRIIHMDYIFDFIKEKKIFRFLTQSRAKQKEETEEHKIINKKLSNFIYNNEFLNDNYLLIRKRMMNDILNSKIERYSKEEIEILIIEGADLTGLDVLKNLDLLIKMELPYHIRTDRIFERDNHNDINKLVLIDTINYKSQERSKGNKYRKPDIIINNDGDVQELQNKAKDILKQIKEKDKCDDNSFKKRYKIDISRNNPTKEKESRKTKCKADLQK